jgi:hypothetical protein
MSDVWSLARYRMAATPTSKNWQGDAKSIRLSRPVPRLPSRQRGLSHLRPTTPGHTELCARQPASSPILMRAPGPWPRAQPSSTARREPAYCRYSGRNRTHRRCEHGGRSGTARISRLGNPSHRRLWCRRCDCCDPSIRLARFEQKFSRLISKIGLTELRRIHPCRRIAIYDHSGKGYKG